MSQSAVSLSYSTGVRFAACKARKLLLPVMLIWHIGDAYMILTSGLLMMSVATTQK